MTKGKGAAALAAALLASLPMGCLAGVTVEKSDDGVATVARVPLWDRLSARAHVGAVPGRAGVDASQPTWLGGAGLEYRVTRRLVLGAGWEHHSSSGNPFPPELGLDPRRDLRGPVDQDRVTFGFSYRF